MARKLLHLGVIAACVALAFSAVGCNIARDTRTATFVGYAEMPDNSTVAVIKPVAVGDSSTVQASCEIDDLKPGDLVKARYVGKSWKQQQWKPDWEVLSRAEE